MKASDLYDRFKTCIDNTINGWSRADRATEIEQRACAQQTIYGIAQAALYVLPTSEYHELVNYIHEKGFNH